MTRAGKLAAGRFVSRIARREPYAPPPPERRLTVRWRYLPLPRDTHSVDQNAGFSGNKPIY
jgi:hypothetical protein